MAFRDKDIERRTKAERKGQQLKNLYHVVHFHNTFSSGVKPNIH